VHESHLFLHDYCCAHEAFDEYAPAPDDVHLQHAHGMAGLMGGVIVLSAGAC
jgi:hypothetical protein